MARATGALLPQSSKKALAVAGVTELVILSRKTPTEIVVAMAVAMVVAMVVAMMIDVDAAVTTTMIDVDAVAAQIAAAAHVPALSAMKKAIWLATVLTQTPGLLAEIWSATSAMRMDTWPVIVRLLALVLALTMVVDVAVSATSAIKRVTSLVTARALRVVNSPTSALVEKMMTVATHALPMVVVVTKKTRAQVAGVRPTIPATTQTGTMA